MSYPACFDDPVAQQEIEDVCRAYNVDSELLRSLCVLSDGYAGSGRAHGIGNDIQEIIDAFLNRQAEIGD